MENTQIDYSEIPVAEDRPLNQEEWEPPVHKFFGKKLPNGKMEKEPIYRHVEYPRIVYGIVAGRVMAKMVNSDSEFAALGNGWKKTPGEVGVITAPSVEQRLEMEKAADEAKIAAQPVAKPEERKTLSLNKA